MYVQLAREQESMQDEEKPLRKIFTDQPHSHQRFRDNVAHVATQIADKALHNEQLETEARTLHEATETYQKIAKSLFKGGVGADLRPSERLCVSWFAPLNLKLAAEIAELEETKNATGKPYACVILQMPPQELACITLHEVMSMLLRQPQGVPYTRLAKAIAKSVEFHFNMTHFKQDESLATGVNILFREKANDSMWKKHRLARQIAEGEWSDTLLLQTGSFLLERLVECARIEEEEYSSVIVPALVVEVVHPHKLYRNAMQKQRVVTCHKRVYDVIDERIIKSGRLFVVNKPMVCPPQPWTSPDYGGYLSYKTSLIRTDSLRHQLLLQSADLSKIYTPLNYLGSVPWQINSRVLEVVNTIWEAGGAVAGLVSSRPLPPLEYPKEELTPKKKAGLEKGHKRKSAELYSLQCDTVLKLQSAKSYEGRRIYFPCNIDFRGRVYPLPPHLNHLGADLARGLLRFDEARPLGANGLRWLKIHLANVSGRDKLSFEDREAWTNDNLHNVAAVFRDPLGKESPDGLWWQGLENPFQGLATCFELHQALQQPDTFLSYLPIHMDGSCNGLQHYGALGRDAAGGAAVNLVPSERPQDVYNGVLDRVKIRLAAHKDSPNPEERQFATLLEGKVTRKVIKQVVMTSVYGVTLLGAKEQVLNRLKELTNITWPKENTDLFMSRAAMYVAKLALASLGDLFSSAEEIMQWLRTVAKLVANEEQPVSWITPLGLPVMQPYVRKQEYQVATENFRLTIADNSDLLPVSASKQKSALPPNFVHSLDATHMLMTTTDCAKRGLHFAAVHDSFWTHAGTVDEMNESLRKQFVSLYSEPILEDFRETLCMRFPSIDFPPLPKRGSLDINQVLKSKYFFA